MIYRGYRIFITFILSLYMLVGFTSQVQVILETKPVIAGQPFVVTFRIDDPSQRMMPNFNKLEKLFIILSTATSTRVSILNGQSQSEIVWSVTLQTNKVGKFIIPAIDFGALSSPETAIVVEKSSTTTAKPTHVDDQEAPVFLKAAVNNKKPYVNEAVTYTVNLYRQRSVFINGSYQQQEADNALIVPLGKSQDTAILSDGRSFLVESMSYAIYPNDKGKLTIKPPSLRGTLSDIYMRRFDIDANEIQLNVQPIPKSAQNYWLPASQVILSEQFSDDTDKLKQGDTIVRTIQLTANGLPSQLIPEFNMPSSAKVKIYEEKPERDNMAMNNQVIGTLKLQATYLLEQSGTIELPKITVRWFNTKTRKFETATLPKHQWQVSASPTGSANAQTNMPISLAKDTASPKEPAKKINNSLASYWMLIAILAGVVVLLLVGLFVKRILLGRTEQAQAPESPASERQLRNQLKQACKNNNAAEAKRALVQWAACYFDNPGLINLSQISTLVGHLGLNKAINELNQFLYSPKPGRNWRGDALWQAWEDYQYKKKYAKNKKSQSLSLMFPESRQ